MIDLRGLCADLEVAMFKCRTTLDWFKNSLEESSMSELSKLNHAQVLEEFKFFRGLANKTVLLLNVASESLDQSPELHEIQEVLRVAGATINYQRIAIQVISESGFKISSRQASNRGKVAADALHGKAGGSRSKAEEMRRHWATGKFTSRDLCAEQECGDVGLSFSAARKALRGTPNST